MKSYKFILLLIFCIAILIAPILAIKVGFIKYIVMSLFNNNKSNAIAYLQFAGTFLGTITAISGVFIGIDHQKEKEKKL